jgi:hypothetical protein
VHLSRVPARLLAPELPLRRTGETWVYRGVQGVYRKVDFRGLLLFLLYVRLNSCFLSLELGQRVMGPIGQSKGGYPFLARRASLYHWAPPFCFRLRSVPPLLSRSSLVASFARSAISLLLGWILYRWSSRWLACTVEVSSHFSCLFCGAPVGHCCIVLFVLFVVTDLLALRAVQIGLGPEFLPRSCSLPAICLVRIF